MTRLPEDVMIEILVKLPVKTLLRFRCVCKSWYRLIKSRNFIDMHLNCKKNDHSILIVRTIEEDLKIQMLSLHSRSTIWPCFQLPFESPFFVNICEPRNGLLCVTLGATTLLCNPATRELKVLPPRPFISEDPWNSFYMTIGLGFDSSTNDYKVVTIVYCNPTLGDKNMYKCQIYNSSSNSWREVDYEDLPLIEYTPGFGRLFNGALHLIGSSRQCMISFNMTSEVFREMKFPDVGLDVYKKEKAKFLAVVNESLVMLTHTDINPNTDMYEEQQFVDIWVMRQYGVTESWTKQATVGPVFQIYRILSLWKNEAIIVQNHRGRFVSHALDAHVSQALHTHEMNYLESDEYEPFSAMIYQESLVSIN